MSEAADRRAQIDDTEGGDEELIDSGGQESEVLVLSSLLSLGALQISPACRPIADPYLVR